MTIMSRGDWSNMAHVVMLEISVFIFYFNGNLKIIYLRIIPQIDCKFNALSIELISYLRSSGALILYRFIDKINI